MINPQKAGLALGTFFAGWHLAWSLLVLLGLAQKLFNFILWAHMVQMIILIGPFHLGAALTLVLVTFGVGYAFGYTAALAWNRVHSP